MLKLKNRQTDFSNGGLLDFQLVRMKGLEPPRLSALDPKSSSATNYDTSAQKLVVQIYASFYFLQME